MDAVRWAAMTTGELHAALHWLQGKVQLGEKPTGLLFRLLQEVLVREGTTTLEGRPRAAATRTLQLVAEVDSNGSLVAAKSAQQHIGGLGKVYLKAFAAKDGRPSCIGLMAVGVKVSSKLRPTFLAVAADGQHHLKLSSIQQPTCGYRETGYIAASLKRPKPLSQGGKNVLLLACYVPERYQVDEAV